jgi:hypothetical protein
VLLGQQDGAKEVAAELEDEAGAAVGEADQLVEPHRGQPANPGDTVANADHLAAFGQAQGKTVGIFRQAHAVLSSGHPGA